MTDTQDNEVMILFTMDVEPPARADGRTSGPATVEEGGNRVRDYADALAAFGYVPTYFIHPELGETQADLFLEEDSGRDHAALLRSIVRQLADEQPRLKTIVIDVHNDRDFIDLETTSARQLQAVLADLEPTLADFGLRPVSATVEQAIDRFISNQRSTRNA